MPNELEEKIANTKHRIKITVEFILVKYTAYDSIEKAQEALDDDWLFDITNQKGKVIAIESIPDFED